MKIIVQKTRITNCSARYSVISELTIYSKECLSLSKKEQKPVVIWGQHHLRYIKKHKRVFYANLLTSCKLNSYLAGVYEEAENLFRRLVKQLTEKENVTEKLKAENTILWVQRINNIRNLR